MRSHPSLSKTLHSPPEPWVKALKRSWQQSPTALQVTSARIPAQPHAEALAGARHLTPPPVLRKCEKQ